MGYPRNGKPASERKPRKTVLSKDYLYHMNSRCSAAIKKHHELMKDDPEHLTTEFLVNITGCKCKLKKKEKMIKCHNH